MNYSFGKFLNLKLVTLTTLSLLIAGFAFAKTKNIQQHKNSQQTITNSDDIYLQSQLEGQEQYILGGDLLIKLVLKNSSGKQIKVKAIESQKFHFILETRAVDKEASSTQTTDVNANGLYQKVENRVLTKIPQEEQEGKRIVFGERMIRYTTLNGDESMNLAIDLSRRFYGRLDSGKYKLTVKFENGQMADKEFTIIYDDEKSSVLLNDLLKSDNDADQKWAFYNFSKFNKVKLTVALQEMQQSNDERIRRYAFSALLKINAPAKED